MLKSFANTKQLGGLRRGARVYTMQQQRPCGSSAVERAADVSQEVTFAAALRLSQHGWSESVDRATSNANARNVFFTNFIEQPHPERRHGSWLNRPPRGGIRRN
ncbi:hypothetical protein DIPPA_32713 [Diplonema papillatum]|nr:hypothetical protein DIPPA_32713 [Diplonema papillatum]